MAEGKKSVIVYVDWIHIFEGLEDDEAGKLIKHLLRYVNDLNPEPPDKLTKIAFEPIKQQLKRDLIKWEETGLERSKSGHLGGIKSGEARRGMKQTQANEANASKSKQTQANEAVNVNGIENVNDKTDRQAIFSFFKTHKRNVFSDSQIERCAEKFLNHCEKIGWNKINSWQAMADKWIENEKPDKENFENNIEPTRKRTEI